MLARFVPASGVNTNREVIETYSTAGTRLSPPMVLGPASDYARISLTGKVAESDTQIYNDTEVPRLKIWNVAGRHVTHQFNPKGVANFPTLSPDGTRVAYQSSTPSDYGQITNLKTGQTTRLGRYVCGGGYTYFAISQDNHRVAGNGICGLLYVWNANTGEQIGQPFRFVGDLNLGPLRFSPNGKLLAVGNSGDLGQVTIVDVQTHQTVATVTGGTAEIQEVSFSPDGTMFADRQSGSHRAYLADRHRGAAARVRSAGTRQQRGLQPGRRSLATLDFQGVIRILPACSDCRDSTALMAEAAARVTRQLTPAERRAFVQ